MIKPINKNDPTLRAIADKYSGGNLDILADAGYQEDDVVMTFKQAMKTFGVAGQMLKGLSGKHTNLCFYKKDIDEETKEVVLKPCYFSVYSLSDIEKVIQTNKAA